ncbi:MAG TPA: insulinase family protein [Luteibaculaceae bacterium]|nr:insulinase family protein [Luteibaculaceae bacterium]
MKKLIVSALALSLLAGQASAQTAGSKPKVAPSATKVDRSKAPKAGPAPKIQIGNAEKFVLSNGLTVLLVENHKLPRVSFQLNVEYTPFLEGAIAGNSEIAGSLLKTGTTKRTKEQIDQEIDFIGASLSTSSGGIFLSSLSKHTEKVLDIASDVLLNPTFPTAELEKLKKQTISGLKQQKESADAIAANVAKVLRYGKNHPMGEITTEESVAKITQESVKQFYTTYFKPNTSYLVIVGDITRAKAEELTNKYFGKWTRGEVPSAALPEYTTPTGTEVVFVPKTGAVQSVINVTYPVDFKPGNPDAIKASVMNAILGGGVFSGRLMQNLREGKGYTYGANSQLATNKYVGFFNAFASVRNEVTDSSVTEFLYEMSRLRNEPVTETEFTRIKNYMNGSFARSLESPQTIANFALSQELYKLPADYYKNYLSNLAAVSLTDVQDMAKKYIKPDNAYILVVGNKEVADKLVRFDADKELTYLDAFGNPTKLTEIKAAPQGVTTKSIFEKAVLSFTESADMASATKKLKALKDVTIKSKAEIQGNEIELVQYKKAPGKTAQVITFQGQVFQKKTFNGKTGKTVSMMGSKDMEAEEIQEALEESQMIEEMNYLMTDRKAELKGVEPVNGKDAYVVDIFNSKGEASTVYYDVASGNKVKVITTAEVPEMGKVTSISEFENYKSVNGYSFPFVQKISGAQNLTLNVETVEVNKKLSDDLFN